MASSLISSSHHIDFDSVFGIDDTGLVQMFETLIATGLKEFLGFTAVFYEADLTDFSKIAQAGGSFDAVTRDRFMLMTAITFDVKVNWSSLLFGVLQDMVTPGSRQAKGFEIQICVLLKNVPGLVLGESRAFPASRVLTEKTVHRYVTINEKVGMEEIADAPRVKKTPAKRTVSTKRPVGDGEEAPIVKKQRTTKGKPVPPAPKRKSQKRKRRLILEGDDEIVDSAPEQPAAEAATDVQETKLENEQAVTAADNVTVETVVERVDEPVPESAVADVERVWEQPAVETVEEATTDDADHIIQQVLGQLDSVTTTDSGDQPTGTDAETIPCDSEDDMDPDVGNQTLPEVRETNVILETDDVSGTAIGSDVGNQQLQIDAYDSREDATIDSFISDPGEEMELVVEEQSADEAMSLEDILMSIPVEVPLPSTGVEITKITMGKEIKIPGVDERTWYLASLPQIPVNDKGKEPLLVKDLIKGKPPQEHYSLICADIDLLVQLREQSGVNPSGSQQESVHIFEVQRSFGDEILRIVEDKFVPGEGSSGTDLKVIDMLSDLHLFILEELKQQALAHGLRWDRTCCSRMFEGRPRDRGAVIARNNTNTPSKCWIRTMILVDGVWVVEPCCDQWVKIPRPVVHNEVPRQLSYVDTLPAVSDFFKILRKRWADVCIDAAESFVSEKLLPISVLSYPPFQMPDMNFDETDIAATLPSLPALSTDISASFDDLQISLSARLDESQSDILSKLHTIEKGLCDSLQQQEEAFRTLIQGARQESQTIDDVQTLRFNEFRKSVLASSVSATTDLMDVKKALRELNLRGDNDKKGEGSSRGPQPPPDDLNRDSRNAGGDTARSIVERLISADRERERERSRGNISGSYKRRRY
ncbi:protein binding protein [Dorcoceras hygrometricum]|uniref:Protein binding protein n=1 Tax=Dorcoceras hygrometricum TaxID=472368 RepID=A0A2Z7BJG0_9LAMI|nr:protein binding protein [Dorcoceras hygrometricum]